jgi:hypothetical protein
MLREKLSGGGLLGGALVSVVVSTAVISKAVPSGSGSVSEDSSRRVMLLIR